jgi:hypothetical protein
VDTSHGPAPDKMGSTLILRLDLAHVHYFRNSHAPETLLGIER